MNTKTGNGIIFPIQLPKGLEMDIKTGNGTITIFPLIAHEDDEKAPQPSSPSGSPRGEWKSIVFPIEAQDNQKFNIDQAVEVDTGDGWVRARIFAFVPDTNRYSVYVPSHDQQWDDVYSCELRAADDANSTAGSDEPEQSCESQGYNYEDIQEVPQEYVQKHSLEFSIQRRPMDQFPGYKMDPDTLIITEVDDTLHEEGLRPGTTLLEVNGSPIHDWDAYCKTAGERQEFTIKVFDEIWEVDNADSTTTSDAPEHSCDSQGANVPIPVPTTPESEGPPSFPILPPSPTASTAGAVPQKPKLKFRRRLASDYSPQRIMGALLTEIEQTGN